MKLEEIFEEYRKIAEKAVQLRQLNTKKCDELEQVAETNINLARQITDLNKTENNLLKIKDVNEKMQIDRIRLQQAIKKEEKLAPKYNESIITLYNAAEESVSKTNIERDYKHRLKNYLTSRNMGLHLDLDAPKDVIKGFVVNIRTSNIKTFEFKKNEMSEDEIQQKILTISMEMNPENHEIWSKLFEE